MVKVASSQQPAAESEAWRFFLSPHFPQKFFLRPEKMKLGFTGILCTGVRWITGLQ